MKVFLMCIGLAANIVVWWLLQMIFPGLRPANVEFGGFWWGVLHGLQSPSNAFFNLIGNDALIVAEHTTRMSYVVGFIIGVLIILFGLNTSLNKRKPVNKEEEVREAVNKVMPDLDAIISSVTEGNVSEVVVPDAKAVTNNETDNKGRYKEAENMFNLDDNFLTEIGIIDMPEPARGELVEGIQQMINDRVTLAMADQIDDSLIDGLNEINSSPKLAKKWLEKNLPHYSRSQEFAQFLQHVPAEEAVVTQLYAQNKWFEMNLPNLPSVVEKIKNDIMQELKALNGMI